MRLSDLRALPRKDLILFANEALANGLGFLEVWKATPPLKRGQKLACAASVRRSIREAEWVVRQLRTRDRGVVSVDAEGLAGRLAQFEAEAQIMEPAAAQNLLMF